MFSEYITREVYSDETKVVGLTKRGHLIIEEKSDLKLNSILLLDENVKYIKKYIEKAIKKLDNNKSKIYERTDWGITTKIYATSVHAEDLTYKYDDIIISQNDYDNVTFEGTELVEILNGLKTNFKKNEGV